MDRVRSMLHADEVYRIPLTGRGITAVVLDTGIVRHPDYRERILAFRDFVNGRAGCYDDAAHGTHVAGILGGDGRSSRGKYRGIAPGCGLIALKVLDERGQGKMEHLLRAVEWSIENRERYGIRILNISVGAQGEENIKAKELIACVEEAWDCGLFVVAAAGNLGPGRKSITAPGSSKKVLTVGAADDFGIYRNGNRKDYSGRGPTMECVCKPEVVAPGTAVISCSSLWRQGKYYTVKSGTSMATPAVAGAAALLLEAEPGLTNVEVKMRFRQAAADIGYPKNRQGWGMPDIRRLLGR